MKFVQFQSTTLEEMGVVLLLCVISSVKRESPCDSHARMYLRGGGCKKGEIKTALDKNGRKNWEGVWTIETENERF